MRISIGCRRIGEGEPCFIIAEAGINHGGDLSKAKKLVESAAKCGADAIKFQTHLPEKEMLSEVPTADYVGESLFDLLKKVELSREDHIKLMEYSSKKGILFLSTPFSREAADLLDSLDVAAFKTGSGELTNLPLLGHIAKKGKPMIVSTGMSNIQEIGDTIRFLRGMKAKFVLMHCTSTYPTKYEDVNLKFIEVLRKKFGIPVGLSDHSIGIFTALAGVAFGACIVEKHFTIDRNWPGPDQKASIEPDELSELVAGIRAIEKALGSSKKVTKEELQIQKMARESVVSLVDMPMGKLITPSMVWVKRPGTGIPARDLSKVVGKKAKVRIKAGTLIQWRDLE